MAVSNGIRDRFLPHAIESLSDAKRQNSSVTAGGGNDVYVSPFYHSAPAKLQSRHQVMRFERHGTKRGDAATSFFMAMTGEIACHIQLMMDDLEIFRDAIANGIELETNSSETLCQCIVHLMG